MTPLSCPSPLVRTLFHRCTAGKEKINSAYCPASALPIPIMYPGYSALQTAPGIVEKTIAAGFMKRIP